MRLLPDNSDAQQWPCLASSHVSDTGGKTPNTPLYQESYMGKTGTIWQLFRALFPSTWRTLSPDALFTRIWDTRKHPGICHIFVLSLLVSRSNVPRNAQFSWQTLNCQIIPVLPSYFPPLSRQMRGRGDFCVPWSTTLSCK